MAFEISTARYSLEDLVNDPIKLNDRSLTRVHGRFVVFSQRSILFDHCDCCTVFGPEEIRSYAALLMANPVGFIQHSSYQFLEKMFEYFDFPSESVDRILNILTGPRGVLLIEGPELTLWLLVIEELLAVHFTSTDMWPAVVSRTTYDNTGVMNVLLESVCRASQRAASP